MSEMVTVLDTETCGFEGGLVEIAGVRLDDAAVGAVHQSLIRPDRPIEIGAMATHHITEAEVADAGDVEEVLRESGGFYDSPILAAHNAVFDSQMLPERFRARNLIYPSSVHKGDRVWICTWRCALHLWPEAPGHSNQVLRYWLGLDVSDMPDGAGATPHRALYDTWVTSKLLVRLRESASLDELVGLSGEPVLLKKVGFGKHKGSLWADVDRGYLRWVAGSSDSSVDAVYTARYYLDS